MYLVGHTASRFKLKMMLSPFAALERTIFYQKSVNDQSNYNLQSLPAIICYRAGRSFVLRKNGRSGAEVLSAVQDAEAVIAQK